MIERKVLENLRSRWGRGKLLLVLGPRQVGKSTLMHQLVDQGGYRTLWLNADEPDIRQRLTAPTSTQLAALIGDHAAVVIDEAQRIPDIGITLKLLIDTLPHPQPQILVTGSSALELADRIHEPLTGRRLDFPLLPLSYAELAAFRSPLEERRLLEHRLLYGSYPEVVTTPGGERELLRHLAESYLYKDLLAYNQIKSPLQLEKLLQALALQIGSEVSYHELAGLVGLNVATVERYIDLLEKAFVLFRLPSLARNVPTELRKGKKIYFHDTGIRNAVLNNFAPLALRPDVGALWENYCVAERLRRNRYPPRSCFWRTQAQQEVDLVEESDGHLAAFEFKWNPARPGRFPLTFSRAYPEATLTTVTPDNVAEFLGD